MAKKSRSKAARLKSRRADGTIKSGYYLSCNGGQPRRVKKK